MTLQDIIPYAHQLLAESIKPNETVIDATCGHGRDTLFLSRITGDQGHVLAFDIQKQAIESTRHILQTHQRDNVSIIHDSHAMLSDYLSPEMKGRIGGAVFNLGYLPKSDKTVTTRAESTIPAIDTIFNFLKKDGLIVLVVYPGHKGGQQEKEAIMEHLGRLDPKKGSVLQYSFINQRNHPPFILAIQKH